MRRWNKNENEKENENENENENEIEKWEMRTKLWINKKNIFLISCQINI